MDLPAPTQPAIPGRIRPPAAAVPPARIEGTVLPARRQLLRIEPGCRELHQPLSRTKSRFRYLSASPLPREPLSRAAPPGFGLERRSCHPHKPCSVQNPAPAAGTTRRSAKQRASPAARPLLCLELLSIRRELDHSGQIGGRGSARPRFRPMIGTRRQHDRNSAWNTGAATGTTSDRSRSALARVAAPRLRMDLHLCRPPLRVFARKRRSPSEQSLNPAEKRILPAEEPRFRPKLLPGALPWPLFRTEHRISGWQLRRSGRNNTCAGGTTLSPFEIPFAPAETISNFAIALDRLPSGPK
jgi:hypothetical protein